MVSDEELLKEIQRLASDGEPPTAREMTRDGKWSVITFQRHFGTWNNAVQSSGFVVNRVGKYDRKELLEIIRHHSDGRQAPTNDEFQQDANIAARTVVGRFDGWWKAVVQAGLIPRVRAPLTTSQFRRFHQATLNRDEPKKSVAGLFLLFTGLPAEIVSKIKPSWFDYLSSDKYSTILTVPDRHLSSGGTDEWTIKLPTTYTIDGTARKTQLPSLVQWVIKQAPYSDRSFPNRDAIEKLSHRIARDVEIPRKSTENSHIGVCPDVTSRDLRASAGVQMARVGAPKKRIKRHLGIEHTQWDADVEDFFLWLYVHEGEVHPDYDPPDVVLDPVSP